MKRKRRKWVALVLALASGGVAGYLALDYLQSRPFVPTTSAATGSERVVIAARDLEIGAVVEPADVKLVDWPGNAVPPGYARDTKSVVGRGVITPVSANEPLLATKLADKEAGGGLPIVIPEGMRAVSVKVDEVVGVAGFVTPGTRVDVLVTLNPGGDRANTATRVILQNVRTLAAGQSIQQTAEGSPQTVTVITLLVTPEQAEKLTLGATEGRIQLALRNTLDTGEIETLGVQAGTLVQGPRPEPRPSRGSVRRGTTVVTYNGSERTVTSF